MKDKLKIVEISELKDHAGHGVALDKLKKLDLAMADVERRIDLTTVKMSRYGTVERYLSRTGLVFTADEGTLERIAVGIIETGKVTPEIIAKVRRGEPELRLEGYEMELIREVRDAEANKDLLKRAIAIQKREVLRQKNLAIEEICNGLRTERERIARALATALLQFSATLRDELAFVEKLRIRDAAILSGLSLAPFPLTGSPRDPEAIAWVAQALGMPPHEAKHLLAAGGESTREIA